jgi:hypothetical protein
LKYYFDEIRENLTESFIFLFISQILNFFPLPDARLEKRHRFRKEIDPAGDHQQKRQGQQPPEEVLQVRLHLEKHLVNFHTFNYS